MSADTASYKLEVAFNENVAGVFTVDTSALDGTDGLTDTGLFDGTFDDVTGDAQDRYQVVFGTDHLMTAVQPANLTVTVAKVDQPDYWNPTNPASPLNSVVPGFVPMRPVKLTAIADGYAASPLTTSGNEITDASRAAALAWGTGQQGGQTDGLQSDGSFFIGRAATNLHPHGQCDTNGNYGVNGAGTTIGAPDATVPFQCTPQSIPVVCDGTVANQGCHADSNTGLAAAAGTMGAVSVRAKLAAGAAYTAWTQWTHTDGTFTTGPVLAVVGTGAEQLITPQAVAVAAGKTGDKVQVVLQINGTRAETFHVANPMLEKGQQVVAPYVPTSGGVTATKPAARVQAPAALISESQFAVVIRGRAGWASSAVSGLFKEFFGWRDAGAAGWQLFYRGSSGDFRMRAIKSDGTTVTDAIVASVVNSADEFTLIGQYDGSNIKLSLNGGPSVSVAVPFTPTVAATVFDIGSDGTGAGQCDCDILYAATFTGVLSDSDAAWIHAQLAAGAEPWPADLNDHDPAMACTAVLPFTDTTYLTPNVEYSLFRGFLRHATWNSTGRTCELYAEDLLLWASRVYPVIPSTGPTTMGNVVTLLFQQVDPTVTPICGHGINLPDFSADGSESVTTILTNLLAVDLGTVFINSDGVPVYEQHDTPLTRLPAATIQITSQASEEQAGVDLDEIVTRATVEQLDETGTVIRTWSQVNTAAEQKYGRADAPAVSSSYVTDGGSLASELVYQGATGKIPVTVKVANVDTTTLLLQLQRQLQTVFTVQDDFGGTQGDAVVQQITHTIQTGLHETDYLMSQRPYGTFTVDTSALDGTDGLRYE